MSTTSSGDAGKNDGEPDKKEVGWGDEGALGELVKGVGKGAWETLTNPVKWALGGLGLGGDDTSK